ncbi:MAG: alpha/beta hydrolase [Acidimicrobiales bacterium]
MAQTEDLHHVDLPGTGPDRPPIVLVHGLSSCLRLWDGVASRLQALGHRVVACDLRGHGLSPKPDGPYDVATLAADVAALIEQLELGPCLLAGQSYGGTVVMQLAADRPDLADRVVCIDGGFLDLATRYPEWERCRKELSPPQLAGRPLAAIRLRMKVERAGWPPEALEAQLACFEKRDDGTAAPWLSMERHLEVLHGLWSVDAAALWARLSVPVLLVAAERPGSQVKRPIHDEVARCQAVLSEHTMNMVMWMDGAHDLHAQHPEPVARLIHDWAGG